MKAAILNDLTKCIGCQACAYACKEKNDLDKSVAVNKLSAQTWTACEQKNGVNIRRYCMHCEHPACASACPVGALTKTEYGAVVYDKDKCMGCRYCMIACPFGIPTYEWDKPLPTVKKCILCFDQAAQKGTIPACTSVCPTGATVFGDREQLIEIARARIVSNPEKYVDHIYGVKEAGGTSVLYVSPVPFEELGFPPSIRDEDYPELTWNVLSKIPNIVSTAGVTLVGLAWIINRRIKLSEEKK